MKLFPAIDIMQGRAVRLLLGKRDMMTDYGVPVDCAKRFKDEGAKYLHVVDLDAAFSDGNNLAHIERIAAIGVPVQTGGGVRTIADVRRRLDAGAARVILGTVAAENPDFCREAAAMFPGGVVCGIDVKDGFAAVRGWTEKASVRAEELGLLMKGAGVDTAVYTDISRDGALTGVNVEASKRFGEATGLMVIASGGVGSIGDIERLKAAGVYGAILGKSLYEGKVRLCEAICLEDE